MTTTKFQVGDVVRLKSGGPKMTVSALHKEKDSITASFFRPTELDFVFGELEVHNFVPEVLVKVVEA